MRLRPLRGPCCSIDLQDLHEVLKHPDPCPCEADKPRERLLPAGEEFEVVQQQMQQLQKKDISVNFRVVSNAFGEEKEKVCDWCDILVLPTLSENFALVIAEALERGKRVITTDGAPAWGDGNDYGGRLTYLKGYRDGSPTERVRLLRESIGSLVCK